MSLSKASALGVISSILSGMALFLVFRISVELVGAVLLGSWVLIQSAFVLARLPEAGVGINLTRLVSIDSRERDVGVWPFLTAGFLLGVAPILLIGLLILEPTVWLLSTFFKSQLNLSTLRVLTGLSLATALFGSTAAVALSIIEGLGGLARRHCATIASNIALMAFVYPLVNEYGVIGIGLTYCTQAGVLCVFGLLLVRRANDPNRDATYSVLVVARRLWRENMTASGMALTRMSFEPWTKFLVAYGGSLAAVAYLDLALKVAGQIRVSLQAATQPLLTLGARTSDSEIERARVGFDRAHQLVTKSNVFLITLQIASAALISYLGLGRVSEEFILFFVMLTVGNAINSIGVVGYYYDASGGHLGRLFNIHSRMMLLNLLLGGAGVLLFGAVGAVAAYALSFAYGGLALSSSWMTASGRCWREELRREGRALALAGAALALAALLIWGPTTDIHDLAAAAASGLVSMALFAVFLQRNWRAFR